MREFKITTTVQGDTREEALENLIESLNSGADVDSIAEITDTPAEQGIRAAVAENNKRALGEGRTPQRSGTWAENNMEKNERQAIQKLIDALELLTRTVEGFGGAVHLAALYGKQMTAEVRRAFPGEFDPVTGVTLPRS